MATDWEQIGAIAGVASVALAALGGASWIRSIYRRTLGRRRHLYRRLRRLGTGMQLTAVEALMDGPPAMQKSYPTVEGHVIRKLRDFIWIDPLFYLQVWCDEDSEVLAFWVISRRRRFAPRFSCPAGSGTTVARRFLSGVAGGDRGDLRFRLTHRLRPLFRVKLQRTPFSAISSDYEPMDTTYAVGARLLNYGETYEFGNPGQFQTWVFGLNSAGWFQSAPPSDEDPDALKRYRNIGKPNVFGVIGSGASDLLESVGGDAPGPHVERVRTIP